MSDSSVISKIKELRKDLDKETSYLQEQMELPLNGDLVKNLQSENNSIELSKGIAISKWVRKITSQFESVDPFYK
ncbi:MAG: hypothetical protein HOF63_04820 [Thiotrichales bacterium]|jgi:hypothetical protein|nr:hypothetical protein [Thiotrichales bacterium]MBT3457293.1 hypothetical protein [Thiotrichales bacterium]MBT3854916.1 hypothetical protein [Thiotrichales bacterium]MBT5499137.1 hypothetical protein [Thiotrichales bacterium]MBT5983861.1 hypothetical protein [Thiotrichales bacterium]|tara:strand:- start:1426 stop:1650 length:225 start_codon:yes stop_codon:yes gene_type:complete